MLESRDRGVRKEHDLIRKLTVVSLLAVFVVPGVARAAVANHPIRDSNGFTESFASDPTLHPPIISMTGSDPDQNASGDIFTDAQNSIQAGPMIISPSGQLIWFDPLDHGNFAHDVAVQTYEGQSVLTFWESDNGGQCEILNHNYQEVTPPIHAGNGLTTGDHEFQITPQGTALVVAQKTVHRNLTSVHGPRNGSVSDEWIQDIDIATGQVLWQWNADAHLKLKTSYAYRPGFSTWDFTHMNSIQQLPNDKLLVSMRNTWAIYEIDERTGRIVWTLGGKHSTFKMGPGTQFEWQHDARLQQDGTVTTFDDASDGSQTDERQSRALRIRLNLRTHRATLVRAYTNNPPLLSWSQGNVQVLPDGNTFVDWGQQPYLTEFSRTGRQLFSLHFHSPLQTYRGYRFQWWGQPTTPPSIVASPSSTGTNVYASWNGATGVASWQVLAGSSPATLQPIEQFPSTDFETVLPVSATGPYFAVQALNITGGVLGTSATVQTGG